MAGYLSWEELVGEPEVVEPAETADQPPAALTPELRALMDERAKLEQRLLKLIGQAPPDPQDAREQARFPMPIHTAESRLADKQRAREEERARAAARRALEAAKLQAEEERARAERRRDQERDAIQQRRLHALERIRDQEQLEARARQLLADELIRQRWAEQRTSAVREAQARRRLEWRQFEERYERTHERARQLRRERREEEAKTAERLASRRTRRSDPFSSDPLSVD